jgi:uncharacterized membrane protein
MSVSRQRGRTWRLALAGLGGALSLLLVYTHYRAYTAPGASDYCAMGQRVDCARVALSQHAVWLQLPVALWGVLGFLAIGCAAWQRSRWVLPLSVVAAGSSLVLLGLSVFAIGAVCPLCLLVHLCSFGLLALAVRSRHEEAAPLSELEPSLLSLAPALGVLLASWLFLPRYWGAFDFRAELPFAHGTTALGDAWIGAEEPTLIVEEFVDYACPHCQAASADSLRRLAQHPSELRLVRRYFPLLPCAPESAGRCMPLRIAFCAGEQHKFWQADRWLFQHATLSVTPDPAQVALDLELDAAQLLGCVERADVYERAIDASKRAKKQRIPGTPYYAVEGRKMSHPEALELIEAL